MIAVTIDFPSFSLCNIVTQSNATNRLYIFDMPSATKQTNDCTANGKLYVLRAMCIELEVTTIKQTGRQK